MPAFRVTMDGADGTVVDQDSSHIYLKFDLADQGVLIERGVAAERLRTPNMGIPLNPFDGKQFLTPETDTEKCIRAWCDFAGLPSAERFEMATPALAPAHFHPRMWRQHAGPDVTKEYGETFSRAKRAAGLVFDEALQIFRVVEPDPANLAAFGLGFRRLLIQACTEIEASWRGILVANGVPERRFTTNDYVRLRDVMRLPDWSVQPDEFPQYPVLAPFRDWDDHRPTDSLPWYSAYNAVKHDAESALPQANLGNAMQALAALAVILIAQFGENKTTSPFGTRAQPKWRPAEQTIPAGLPGTPAAWTRANAL